MQQTVYRNTDARTKKLHRTTDCRHAQKASNLGEKELSMFPNPEFCNRCWSECQECGTILAVGYLCDDCG